MGRIIVSEFLSLDGVMEAPEHWHFPYISPDMAAATTAHILDSNALLLGRVTFEAFAAHWPACTNNEHGIADKLNAMPKFVVTNSLEVVKWNNSTILRGDAVKAVRRLKMQFEGILSIPGSATLVEALQNADLVDEYQLMIHPVVLGTGRRLFSQAAEVSRLHLDTTTTFASGVVALTYRRDATASEFELHAGSSRRIP